MRKTLHKIQMKIKPRPALYFLIPYLLGIIAGKWVSLPFLWLWIFVLLCFIGSMVTRTRQRFLCYALLHLSIFAGGMLRLETATHSPIPPHFYNAPIHFSGTTVYQPERGEAWDACYAVGELQLLSDPAQQVPAKLDLPVTVSSSVWIRPRTTGPSEMPHQIPGVATAPLR